MEHELRAESSRRRRSQGRRVEDLLGPRVPRPPRPEPPAAESPLEQSHASRVSEPERAELEHSLASRGLIPPEAPGPIQLDDEFEVTGELGQGGMGVVLAARERTSGRPVALKRLRRQGDRARFLREAETVAQLEHPAIVRLLRVLRLDDEDLALVLEQVDGPDLARVVRGQGPLELEQALELTRTVVEALGYAHDKGVIHRDVKPHNVLLDSQGRARLTDFGLALVPDVHSLSVAGWVGTVDYMAPEQREAAHRVDARADVFGVGATLYHLLTGSAPRVIREGRLPQPVRELVLTCVEERPADRYPDMPALREDLERLLACLRRDRSGSELPLRRIADDYQRRLDRSQRSGRARRLALAAAGLVRLGLLPPDTPAQLEARLELGQPWESELERLVGVILAVDAAPALLADAEALLKTALAGVTLESAGRRALRRLARASRASRPPELAERLAGVAQRLAQSGLLSPGQLAALARQAAHQTPAKTVERLLGLLRIDYRMGTAEWRRQAGQVRRALDDLRAALPEPDLAARVRRERISLELEWEARRAQEESSAQAKSSAEEGREAD